ncbi:hypothetical protein GCM10023082_56320 [Streptomyces tremellae]|uniref:Uncharacterized protein n=1 Tax=Streptomyces tremellae TaxID=1124239 RepID=A0ABP7G209_9ACTN
MIRTSSGRTATDSAIEAALMAESYERAPSARLRTGAADRLAAHRDRCDPADTRSHRTPPCPCAPLAHGPGRSTGTAGPQARDSG